MKSLYTKIFAILFAFAAPSASAFADSVSRLPYPVWGQSIGVYNALIISADAQEYRNSKDYQRMRRASLDGELKLGDYFSVSAGYGYKDFYGTQSTPWSGWDRWKVGLKSYYKFGIFSLGAGVSVLGPAASEVWTGERNPDLLLVRPHLGFALDFGKTKFQAFALYERETDSKFKEPVQEKFYRYMEAGGTLSYETELGIILLMETTYRMAVEETISERSDSFNLHPGVQFPVGDNGRLAISGLYGLRYENTYDRGAKIAYQYFFGQ